MKIYNIRESKDFFERLSGCNGKVEIVRDDGKIVEFNPEHNYFNGTISQLEVKFQKTEDLDNILSFIMNQRKYA